MRLAELRDRNQIVVYLDEASFHLWLKKTHTWTRADRPVRIVLGQNRCNGVTVIGAISTSLNRPVFSQEKSTNAEAFGKFLVKVRCGLQTVDKGYIVLDNHPAHRTIANREMARQLNFELLFMPPYTPELNSIEALWSVIKRDFKQRAESQNFIRHKQEDFVEMLQEALDDVSP